MKESAEGGLVSREWIYGGEDWRRAECRDIREKGRAWTSPHFPIPRNTSKLGRGENWHWNLRGRATSKGLPASLQQYIE